MIIVQWLRDINFGFLNSTSFRIMSWKPVIGVVTNVVDDDVMGNMNLFQLYNLDNSEVVIPSCWNIMPIVQAERGIDFYILRRDIILMNEMTEKKIWDFTFLCKCPS